MAVGNEHTGFVLGQRSFSRHHVHAEPSLGFGPLGYRREEDGFAKPFNPMNMLAWFGSPGALSSPSITSSTSWRRPANSDGTLPNVGAKELGAI